MSLVIADDHPIVLGGLEQLFRAEGGFEIRARARDGEEALRAVRLHRPDVLVLDVRMPTTDGLTVLRTMREERIPTRAVLLTVALDEERLAEALRLGACGIVLKEMAPEVLIRAVREVHAGGQYLEGGLVGRTLRRLLERESAVRRTTAVLTAREIEIVKMVAAGLRNRGIAERLFISEGTVKIHLHNVYEKLGIGGRVELALYARDHGLG